VSSCTLGEEDCRWVVSPQQTITTTNTTKNKQGPVRLSQTFEDVFVHGST